MKAKTLACALLAVSLCGCSPAENNAADSKRDTIKEDRKSENKDSDVISFTDDTGEKIEIKKPERVAITIGSFADLYDLAGGKDAIKAAAHDTWTNFNLNLDEDVQDLGAIHDINTETLIAAKPDLVIASAKNENTLAMKQQLEEAGIPIAYFDVSSFEDYLRVLKIFTELTGDEEAYKEYGTDIEKDVEKAKKMANGSKPTVLYLRAAGSAIKAQNETDTVLGDMLYNLDTENVAAQDSNLMAELSMEEIVKQNPEYIFVVLQGSDDSKARKLYEEQLVNDPAWSSLDAVKNDKVFILDQTLYNLKPNEKWGEAYLNLADILYGNQ